MSSILAWKSWNWLSSAKHFQGKPGRSSSDMSSPRYLSNFHTSPGSNLVMPSGGDHFLKRTDWPVLTSLRYWFCCNNSAVAGLNSYSNQRSGWPYPLVRNTSRGECNPRPALALAHRLLCPVSYTLQYEIGAGCLPQRRTDSICCNRGIIDRFPAIPSRLFGRGCRHQSTADISISR